MNDLFIRFFNPETDSHERNLLFTEIRKDSALMEEFREYLKAWSLTSVHHLPIDDIDLEKEYNILASRIDQKQSPIKLPYEDPTVSLRVLFQVAAVGILLIAMGVAGYYYTKPQVKQLYNEIATKTGEKAQITLSDGTKIWLNASSKLRYPSDMSGKEVHVYLQGEAYFDVNHNEKRLFQVHASDLNIKVLGTAFNVKSYPEEKIVETTLVRGKVRIEGKSKQKEDYVVLLPNQKASYLQSNSQMVVTESNNKNLQRRSDDIPQIKAIASLKNATLVVSNKIDTKFDISWKDGKLEFADEQFITLATKMERWFGVKISISDQDLQKVRYTGTFEKETIEQALRALSISLPFRFSICKDSITIEPK